MSRVHLLRHAMPVLVASADPGEWPLTAEGREAAAALSSRLPSDANRLASGERKAQETLELAAPGRRSVDARLGEVIRPAEPLDPDVRAARRAWVAGALDARHAGWEAPADATARFQAALDAHLPGELVVATHGMIMTAWLVSIGQVAAGEPAARLWDALGLPDIVSADLG